MCKGIGEYRAIMLTKGLDNYQGTAGNDTIIGSIDNGNAELNTLSALDIINGGAGTDTLKIAHTDDTKTAAPVTLGNLSNVEIVTIESAGTKGMTVDASTISGITNLNVTKAAGDVKATAGATTDINATLQAAGAKVDAFGGNNVTVKLTDVTTIGAADVITVGTGGTAPKGDVVVEVTAKAVANVGDDVTLGTIGVTGGKTISVTQKAGNASALVADGAKAGGTTTTHTQGKVTIAANADTTTVTVTQDATVAAANVKAVAAVTEVASVQFTKLASGASFTAGGLTFKASKDLTAAEVASAFANLSATAPTPSKAGPTTAANGDTNGSSVLTNGVFSGSLVAGWNSGAANGDTVVFTASAAKDMTDLTATSGLTITTQGVDAVAGKNVLGVKAGVVDITGAANLKTVTVNGYDETAAAATNNIKGATNTALDTISLANGGGMTIASQAATLALTLEKVGTDKGDAGLTFSAAPTTLNVKSVGNNYIDLSAKATKTLNVSGTGVLKADPTDLAALETVKVTETAGLTLGDVAATVTSVDTSATTGAVSVTIAGDKATYTGGAGVDTVTLKGDVAVSKAINLAGGNDRLDMQGLTTASKVATVDIDGGEGTDTLVLLAASAASTALSANTNFSSKIKNFERLELTTAGNADISVALDKLGFTNYVVTNGVQTGKTLTLDKLGANATIEMATADANDAATEGTIKAVLADATGTADVLNVITKVSAANETFGTLEAAGVETIKLNAIDTVVPPTTGAAIDTATLAVKADKATTLTVEGNSNVTLTLDSATKLLATIDANTLTGKLNVAANGEVAMTIKGGSGADTLAASLGATAKADVIIGGAGNDTITAGSNGATLTGGDGNDLFILTATSAVTGSKEANTYSTITDFKVGDVLELNYFDASTKDVTSFTKLAANLNENTAVFSDYVSAAMGQILVADAVATPGTTAAKGSAVYFNYKGDAYVVVDSGVSTTGTFTNTEDMVIKLTGVNGDNLSWNSEFASVALV